jgi:hypothetical protein
MCSLVIGCNLNETHNGNVQKRLKTTKPLFSKLLRKWGFDMKVAGLVHRDTVDDVFGIKRHKLI